MEEHEVGLLILLPRNTSQLIRWIWLRKIVCDWQANECIEDHCQEDIAIVSGGS